jgi:hypothetical protein
MLMSTSPTDKTQLAKKRKSGMSISYAIKAVLAERGVA